MSGKIIAVANMKGGVGKTATVIALAEALAADAGERVLVMDFDPQASASIVLAGDAYLASLIKDGRTIDAYLEDYLLRGREITLDDCVRGHISDVTHRNQQLLISLLASSPALRTLELKLIYELTKAKFDIEQIVDRLLHLLKTELKRSKKKFDYVLIDCAPGISTLNEASVRLADVVIVPTIPDMLSSYGLQAFCHSIWSKAGARGGLFKKPQKKLPSVLITRRRPTRQHADEAEKIRNERTADDPNFKVFETDIPERAAIADALAKTGSHPSYLDKWGQPVVEIMAALVMELKEELNAAQR